jgi:thiamine-monophosphate kinase
MPQVRSQDEVLQGEEAIIALLAPLAEGYAGAFGLKDDCALLSPPPGTELVLKTDPIAEGVHFLATDAPEDIAWKALATNASDLAAKGAAPLGYLMALSFPHAPRADWMRRFASGLHAAQTALGCHLMGGDTDRRPGPLTISISLIGTVPEGRMVPRGTALPGSKLFVSGTIGDAALGLALLREPAQAAAWGLSPPEADALRRRYRRPEPRLALAPALRQCACAAMDISDGLVKDLDRMLRASGVAGRLRANAVPLSAQARRVVARAPEAFERLITAGDDFEVLAAVPPARAAGFVTMAAAAGVAVTEIGILQAGPPALTIEGPDGNPLPLPVRKGWDHF